MYWYDIYKWLFKDGIDGFIDAYKANCVYNDSSSIKNRKLMIEIKNRYLSPEDQLLFELETK